MSALGDNVRPEMDIKKNQQSDRGGGFSGGRGGGFSRGGGGGDRGGSS